MGKERHSAGMTPAVSPAACEVNPAIRRFRSSVIELLSIESDTEREHSRSREALVHAGKMAAVGRMVASVNHEIRRPLTSMRLFSQHMRELLSCGEVQSSLEALELIEEATGQLIALSRQLEAFSRKTPLNITPLELRRVLEHAQSVLLPKVKTGRHVLKVQVGEQHVLADFDRLALALVNLVDNAMDASTSGMDKRIDVTVEESGCEVAIRVRDHGTGIAPDMMDRIFEAFFTTKPEGQGLGLGLALSNEAIGEMGGRLSAFNHPEGGAVFSVTLPACVPPSPEEQT
jgi:two-component system, NtrC family, C4-dicarboxylate transport sensor histidine kinase DctB